MFGKPKVPKSKILRLAKYLLRTRAGNVALGGMAGIGLGYKAGRELPARIASIAAPEGYSVKERFRIYPSDRGRY